MTKKIKLVLRAASLVSVIGIVPAIVISCGTNNSTNTTNPTKTINSNVATLKQMKSILVNPDINITAAAAAVSLPSGSTSTDLNKLNTYFSVNQIIAAATNGGVTATYSAAVLPTPPPANTTPVNTNNTQLVSNALGSATTSITSDALNTLVITINMTLDSVTATQTVDVIGFPNATQIANINTLNTLISKLSALKLTTVLAQNGILPSNVYKYLNLATSASSDNLNTLSSAFDATSIINDITAVSTTQNPITYTYIVDPITSDNTINGTITIAITLSIGTDVSLVTQTTNLAINGFLTADQSIVNNYVYKFSHNTITGTNAILPSTLTNENIVSYLKNIPSVPTGLVVTYALSQANNTNGTIVITVTASMPNSNAKPFQSKLITISGFLIAATSTLSMGNQYANYWSSTPPTGSNNLGNNANVSSLYIPGANGVNVFNSSAVISTSGTSLPTFISNIIWSNGLTSNDVSSWTETGDNTTGTATYNVTFNNNTTALLIVTGFMSQQRLINLQLISIMKATDIATTPPPINGTSILPATVTAPGIAGMNWGIGPSLDQSLFGEGQTSYAIANSNSINGSVTVIVTFANGVSISLPVSGYLTQNQITVNNYISKINALPVNTITGINTVLPLALTNSNIGSYLNLNNIPSLPAELVLTYAISGLNSTIGTATFTIIASIGSAISIASNPITVNGFLTTDQNEINGYIQNNFQNNATIKGIIAITAISPTPITMTDIGKYVSGIASLPTGVNATFTIVRNANSNLTGIALLTITLTDANAITETSSITVNGFLTPPLNPTDKTSLTALQSIATKIEALSLVTTTQTTKTPAQIYTTISALLSSTSKTLDILNPYFSTTDITAALNGTAIASIAVFNPTTANSSAGTLDFALVLNLETISYTVNFSVSGFLTTNQNIINTYISNANALVANTITGTNTVLASTLTNKNIAAYLNNIPNSVGLVLTYTVSGSNNTNGTIQIVITASITGSTSISSNKITVSGFLTTNQNIINNYIQNDFQNNSAIEGNLTVLPSSIPTAEMTMNNILSYVSGITSLSPGIIASFVVTTNANSDLIGTASLTISLTAANAIPTTFSITINGFKTSITPAQQSNLVTLQGVTTNLGALSLVTTTQTTKTSAQIYTTISALTSLTLSTLAPYFPTADITAALNGATITSIAVSNPTTANSLAGTLDFSLVLSLGTNTSLVSYTANFSVSGFLTAAQSMKNLIDTINLEVNSNMSAPVATTGVTLSNAQTILTHFNITSAQITALSQIPNLLISVTNSSLTNGTVTLLFSGTVNGIPGVSDVTYSHSQSYSGFFAGTPSQIKANLQTYLSNSTNTVNFLQTYLNINQSFLDNLVFNNSLTGNAYWWYTTYSASISDIVFKNIIISYDQTTKTYIATATLVNQLGVKQSNLNGHTVTNYWGEILAGTQMIITLPFSSTSEAISLSSTTNKVTSTVTYPPINVIVSSLGGITLSWTPTNNADQKISGITVNYKPQFGDVTSILMPWKNPLVPNIIL